jgi:4'-phosphopantetheinyl transferase EntD
MHHVFRRATAVPLFDVALLHGRCVGVSLCALDHAAADDAGAAGMQRDRTQPVPSHPAPAPAPATTLPPPSPKLGLHPLEWDLARGMSGERRNEFIGGRLALRRALSHLRSAPAAAGCSQHPLLSCAAGAPILPAGVTGSISHKAGLAVAIAADAAPMAGGADGGGGGGRVGGGAAGATTTTTTKTRAVGVDVELAVVSSFDEEGRFARRVLTPAERVSLGSAALRQALLPAAAVAAAAAAAAAAGAAGGRQQLATRKGGGNVCGSGGRHRSLPDAAAAAAATAAAAGEGTAALQLQLARGLEVKLRFSLKEALFKALFPFVGRRVAFLEAEVRPRADGSCAARLTGLPSAMGAGQPAAAAAAVGGDAAADVTCREDLADLALELQWATLDVDGELFFLTTACVEGRAPPAADAEAVAADAEAEAEAASILAGHRHHA